MAKVTVGTSAVKLDLTGYPDKKGVGQTLLIQCLGTGDLYVDTANTVTASLGVKVAANTSITIPVSAQDIWVIGSAAGVDVRFVALG